jgi:class 3 adenylate cyclase/tetratricopeptide (TPR) repeat protein
MGSALSGCGNVPRQQRNDEICGLTIKSNRRSENMFWLMVICARCGAENPEGFRFCGQCTAPLVEEDSARQSRKVITALFCDVTGSTALGEQLDPEVLRRVLDRYFEEIRAAIERHGGTVAKFIGDAVMAVFGIPLVQEDDALRAVRAAAEIRERLPRVAEEVGVELRFRTGVNTGPVLMGGGENLAVGDAVNVAARLEQAAEPGEIVLGKETLGLVHDAVEVEALEPLELKGKSERVRAYRLLGVDPAAPGFARHLDVRLVGREAELALLHQAWDRAVRESRCHLLTLLGEAGVGKSRLVEELLSGVGDRAMVLRGRCLHYGEGITFWPLVEALMPINEPAAQVLEHLSRGGLAAPEELFWEVRRLLESLATERPVVLYLDDLQWAEPMLLDLLDHVADLSRGAPILLLCTARPELLDDRPGWGGGKLAATTVLLEPLVLEEAEALLDELGNGLDHEARTRVIQAGEGNPLFLEEMAALARERGTVDVPPTIQALLASRLERLGLEERELLEHGAVEGEVFHRMAVRALAGERLAAEVELGLAGLVRKELIRPHPETLQGDEAFRFRHLLIRDAAYDGLPKATRAELHERFAAWLAGAGAGLLELDEIAGWHLEQAVRYRHELGQEIDPRVTRGAVEHLHTAGRRAGARSDVFAAINLLERALALTPGEDPLHAQIAVELADQQVEAGDFARADELMLLAERDPASATLALLTRMEALMQSKPEAALEVIDSKLPELLERLTKLGNQREIGKAHMLAFHRHWLSGQTVSAGEHARLAAEHAAEAADEVLRWRALNWYMATLVWGQAHAASIAYHLRELEQQNPSPYLRAFMDTARGELCRLEGDLPRALELSMQAVEAQEAFGLRMQAAANATNVARVHISAGDPAAAVQALIRGDRVLAEQEECTYRSTVQAFLAYAYAAVHDREATLAACDLSDELGAAEDLINYAITHAVRARLALEDGDTEQAQQWAKSAVRYASKTGFCDVQAEANLQLARVLSAIGRRDEALSAACEALAIQEAKGDRPGIAEAQALLDQL